MKRIKKILASLMVAVIVLTAAPLSGFVGLELNLDWFDFNTKASAASYSGTCGENLTWTFNDETGELIISGTGAMDDFVPSSMPWKEHKNSITGAIISEGVTSIGSGAFYYCTHLTSIIIPESVTYIGASAFFGCENLVSVVIPEGVTSIDDSAFSLCYALTYVDIPNTVKTIGDCAFEATSIVLLYIPDGVISIGEAAFYGSIELERITIPDSVTSLDNSTFADCPKLQSINVSTGNTAYSSDNYGVLFNKDKTEIINYPEGRSETSYTIPNSVTKIEKYAFYGCDKLTSLKIPASVTAIDYYAFGCNDALTDIYYDGTESEWEKIDMKNGEYDFQGITIHFVEPEGPYSGTCGDNLTWSLDAETGELVINGTGEMDDHLSYEDTPWYNYHSSIKKVTIGNGVTTIGSYVFYNCTNLTSITIPEGVTSIGSYTFTCCDSLQKVYYTGTKDEWGSISLGSLNGIPAVTIIFECDSERPYYDCGKCGDTLDWVLYVDYELVISGAGEMGNYSDYTAEQWRKYASLIKKLTIEKGATSIGMCAFMNCSNLTDIIIPDSVTSIGASAFCGCENLVSIVIPDSVTSIGVCAFDGCTSLINITIPDSVTSIGECAFDGCTSLANITIPDSLTSIGWSAFSNTGYYDDHSNWKDDVLYIGNHLIEAKSNLSGSYTIKEGTKCIADSAFDDCTSIVNVMIPDSVTSIDAYAFYNCTNLTSITIPDSITIIRDSTFFDCTNLSDVYYSGTKEDWTKIEIEDNNDPVLNATIHFSEPEDPYSSICGENVTWSIDAETKTLTISGQGAMYDFNESIVVPWQHSYGDFDKIVIEDGVTHIGASSFAYFDNVTDISIPDSVITIGIDAFYNTGYYNDKNNWENGVLYIGNYLIEFNSDISDVCIIPEGILAVADYADKNEEKTVKCILPDSLISIGECAFMGPEVTIPVLGTSIKYFSENAFYDVTFIKVEISPDIEEISENVFEECSIECLTFRNTLKIVGNGTFMQCACEDVYYLGTEEEWNQIVFGSGNEMLTYLYTHNTGCVHFLGSEHKHSYSSKITSPPTGEFEGTETLTCICGDHYEKSVAALGFDVFDGVTIDFETNTMSGFNAGETSLDGYTMPVHDSYIWEYETSNGKLGTGSKAILKDGDTVIGEYTILVYGDTTGDSWYDGQDAIIVDCLANGMLTKDDVSEAVYTAADCNHDGVIDQLDVELLNQAGALLANVDQSKPAEVLLETSAEYVEYLDLIDQSPEIEDETDAPEADAEETPEADTEDAKIDIFEMILNFIKSIFEMLLSYIPMPL